VAYYYYLMAQLPAILPGTPLACGFDEFYELASRYLSRRDQKILDRLTLEAPRDTIPTGSQLADEWLARERSLRLALAKIRATKKNRSQMLTMDETESLGTRISISRAASTAASNENPLEAEQYLIAVRMSWLEELRGNHFFDSEAVFIYGISLLLRERSDLFTVETGRDAYSTIYTQILGEEA